MLNSGCFALSTQHPMCYPHGTHLVLGIKFKTNCTTKTTSVRTFDKINLPDCWVTSAQRSMETLSGNPSKCQYFRCMICWFLWFVPKKMELLGQNVMLLPGKMQDNHEEDPKFVSILLAVLTLVYLFPANKTIMIDRWRCNRYHWGKQTYYWLVKA